MQNQRIEFFFHPFDFNQNLHFVEKDEAGLKRKYLKGISSGIRIDGHGERMTEKCIKSFNEQANSGDILLYADKHGVAFTADIGILTKSEITPAGDWYTEYRLYDESDNMGENTLERANKLWKQVNGLPPYKKPKQKGFSVEGYIPEKGIVQMSDDGKRVIDEVHLDGAIVCPRPAYETSIAHALYKALGEEPPWVIRKGLRETLKFKINEAKMIESFYKGFYKMNDFLFEEIEKIMQNPYVTDQRDRLSILLDEYREMMIDLILNNKEFFVADLADEPNTDSVEVAQVINKMDSKKITVLKSLYSELAKLEKNLIKEVN